RCVGRRFTESPIVVATFDRPLSKLNARARAPGSRGLFGTIACWRGSRHRGGRGARHLGGSTNSARTDESRSSVEQKVRVATPWEQSAVRGRLASRTPPSI